MNIDFEKMGGLVPAIIQDAVTAKVLMLARSLYHHGLLVYPEAAQNCSSVSSQATKSGLRPLRLFVVFALAKTSAISTPLLDI